MRDRLGKFLPLALYVGPDVLMPVASAIAAVVGALLMFGRRTIGLVRSIGHKIAGFFGQH